MLGHNRDLWLYRPGGKQGSRFDRTSTVCSVATAYDTDAGNIDRLEDAGPSLPLQSRHSACL